MLRQNYALRNRCVYHRTILLLSFLYIQFGLVQGFPVFQSKQSASSGFEKSSFIHKSLMTTALKPSHLPIHKHMSMSNTDNNLDDKIKESIEEEITYFSPNKELKEFKSYQNLQDQEEDPSSASSSVNEYSFFDEAIIYVRGGSGGQGSSTYKKGVGRQDAKPDGGDGGKGGDVLVQCDISLNTLAGLTNAWRPNSFGGGGAASSAEGSFTTRPLSFRADNGADGGRMFKNGKYAEDVIIRVPPGTVVQEEVDEFEIDAETGEKNLIRTTLVDIGSVDVSEENNSLVVARGGAGGEGSGVVGKGGRGVRRTRTSPVGGERKRLKLTLKIVADIALVGVPNAGKSTFLASVTRAKPKIANVSSYILHQ